jgi:prepilin-type N-terminal cleavage/methylation domain-containing protein
MITLKNKHGLTLIESLVSILLLGLLMLGVSGSFFISKYSASHAKHRYIAMKILKDHMEREIRAGYDGGNDAEADYYATLTTGNPVAVTIDSRGTADASDDLVGTITPDPYYPNNVEKLDGSQISYGIPYKIIGFTVTWTEDVTSRICRERAVSYVAYHSSS